MAFVSAKACLWSSSPALPPVPPPVIEEGRYRGRLARRVINRRLVVPVIPCQTCELRAGALPAGVICVLVSFQEKAASGFLT